jgi:hypothetical protein
MPDVDPCIAVVDPLAKAACQLTHTGQQTASFASDPLGSIAKSCAEATAWFWEHLAIAINTTTQVDFTNAGFLQSYAMVFAVSSVLVAILWLLAVAKRVIRGVGVGKAIGESIGFLLLAVTASALAPAVLYLVMGVVDAATAGLASGLGDNATRFLTGAGKALQPLPGGGGPVVLIVGSVVGIVVGLVLWVELLLAAAALYVAAVFGPLVFAGLVDRSMWAHTRRWIGLVVGLALVKPITVVVVGLGAGLAANGGPADGFSSVLVAIALLLVAVFASAVLFKMVPVIGDDLAQVHQARKSLQASGPAAAIPGPATVAAQGISAHMRRPTPAAATPPPAPTPPPRSQSRPTPPPAPMPTTPTPAPAPATPGVTA